ncbi:MAG: hypothetical protein MHM6MM_002410 [Cercozoa sp. M6MM]
MALDAPEGLERFFTVNPEDDEEIDSDAFDSGSDDHEDVDDEKHGQLLSDLMRDSGPSELDLRKQAQRMERTEVRAEGESALAGASLSLSSLLAPLGQDAKMTKKIQEFTRGKQATVAPLPKTQQQRITRQEAYDGTSKEVSKWQDIVQVNRQKRTLKLDEGAGKKQTVSLASLSSHYRPDDASTLESDMDALLQQLSARDESETRKGEQLALREMSKEEQKRRMAQLASMRAGLFHAEIKAKRIKKIKSRKFRKLRKQRLAKLNPDMSVEELRELDPEAAQDKEEEMKRARAHARMTLRHQGTTQWSQRLKQRAENVSDEQKEAQREQSRLHKLLMRKVQDDSDESDSDVDEEELAELQKQLQEGEEDKVKKGGIYALKFMRDYRAKQREQQQQLMADFAADAQRELSKLGDGNAEAKSNEVQVSTQATAAEEEKRGRRVFGKSGQAPAFLDSEPKQAKQAKKPKQKEAKKGVVVDAPKSTADLERAKNVRQAEVPQMLDVAAVIDTSGGSTDSSGLKKSKPNQTDGSLDENSDANSRALVRQVFGTSEEEEEFRRSKEALVEEELPQHDSSLYLPGWGRWAGEGVRKPKNKPRFVVEAEEATEQRRKQALAKRADAKLKHVIVSEKARKHEAKYKVMSVPHGHGSVQQYESSLRQPIGAEWNTRRAVERRTAPEVITKEGVAIEPIQWGEAKQDAAVQKHEHEKNEKKKRARAKRQQQGADPPRKRRRNKKNASA